MYHEENKSVIISIMVGKDDMILNRSKVVYIIRDSIRKIALNRNVAIFVLSDEISPTYVAYFEDICQNYSESCDIYLHKLDLNSFSSICASDILMVTSNSSLKELASYAISLCQIYMVNSVIYSNLFVLN